MYLRLALFDDGKLLLSWLLLQKYFCWCWTVLSGCLCDLCQWSIPGLKECVWLALFDTAEGFQEEDPTSFDAEQENQVGMSILERLALFGFYLPWRSSKSYFLTSEHDITCLAGVSVKFEFGVNIIFFSGAIYRFLFAREGGGAFLVVCWLFRQSQWVCREQFLSFCTRHISCGRVWENLPHSRNGTWTWVPIRWGVCERWWGPASP